MAKTTPRIFVESNLSVGAEFALSREQGHYVANVLRCASGDALALFNGGDGEFLGQIILKSR